MDRTLIEAFQQGNVQLFVGSGLSHGVHETSAAFRDRLLRETITTRGGERTLAKILTQENEISSEHIDSAYGLSDIAEFYELYAGSPALLRLIRKIYGRKHTARNRHKNLWKLPGVQLIYTTNYDSLIEDALEPPDHQAPLVATTLEDLTEIQPYRRLVFKPHGCAVKSKTRGDFVITRTDYLNYGSKRVLEELKTLYDIFTRTFLFLGYSLEDSNMRQIIAEAKRLQPNIQAYAVMEAVPEPEMLYWEDKFNLRIKKMDARRFLADVLSLFPPDSTEWGDKVTKRLPAKEKIANIAVDIIGHEGARCGPKGLNVIVDSGTTCLALVTELLARFEQDRLRRITNQIAARDSSPAKGEVGRRASTLEPAQLTIITNSAPVVAIVSGAVHALKGGLALFCTGGLLKAATRALRRRLDKPLSHEEGEESDQGPTKWPYSDLDAYLSGQPGTRQTIAFIGATAFDERGLMTKTLDEVAAKQQFLARANRAYILVDKSKPTSLDKPHVFATIDPDRMMFVTDQKRQMSKLQELGVKVVDSGRDIRRVFEEGSWAGSSLSNGE